MPISLSDILSKRKKVVPTIYCYSLPDVASHNGYIKVGYTDRENVVQRLNEQLHTSAVRYTLLLAESAMRSDGTCFTDHDVHNILRRQGFKQLYEGEDRNEWFACSINDVLNAIAELKTGRRVERGRTATFSMREEQKQAVEQTYAYFNRETSLNPDVAPKYLWNAKMRFGKTFTTYQLAKKMGMKRLLILTFKPAVEAAWQEDLMSHVDFDGWQFVSDKEAKGNASQLDIDFERCDKSRPIVVFGSFQNLLGTNELGGIKAKNEFIHANNWDMVVFDEYHFGAWRDNAKALFREANEETDSDFDYEKYSQEEAGNAINETWLQITTSYYLYLSGTPFRALNTGEFLEDQIFNWTYSDEQSAKMNWDDRNGPNPYAALPRMVMLTYKVPNSIVEVAMNEGYDEFDINEFFKAESEGSDENARFVYEDYVQKWVRLIQGAHKPVDGLKLGNDKPPMPFSDATLLNALSHTLWYLPNVKSCYAMRNLLRQKQNSFFSDYEIVVCAGVKAGIGIDALTPVLRAMDDPMRTKTITLTCGKLTTGVTVRAWSGVFMLRNLKSPESYFQTAFRVQSPWEVIDEKGKRKVVKEECYVFDFALERSLRQISDYSVRLKVDESNPEKKVSDFIKFMPVLAFDGAAMNAISAQDVLDITYAGTSATLLAKRWQTALLVHVDNDTLKKLQSNAKAMEALMNVEGFRALNQDLETIINRSENLKKQKKETDENAVSKEKKKELSDEEKQIKSLRKEVQQNLLRLAARIPAFMYLTDYREQCIKDVITKIEPDLFKKVTGLDVSDFDILCSIGLFDPEIMNQGIFGFRQYENSSLSYAGINRHEGEAVGGWDTVLKREEYDALYSRQQATMTDFASIMGVEEPEQKQEKRYTTPITTTKPRNVVDRYQPPKSKATIIRQEKNQDSDFEVKKGTIVFHKTHGEGTVINLMSNDKYVKVKFQQGEKMFAYPNAFQDGFLSLEKYKV